MGQSLSDVSDFEQLYLQDLSGVHAHQLSLEDMPHSGFWDVPSSHPLVSRVQRVLHKLRETFSGHEIHLTHTPTWEGYSLYE